MPHSLAIDRYYDETRDDAGLNKNIRQEINKSKLNFVSK